MFDGLPETWARTTLGEILSLEYGRSLPESSRLPGDVAVYGSNGIVGFHSEAMVKEKGIVVGRKGTAGSVNVTKGPFWPIDTTYYVLPKLELEFGWIAAILHFLKLGSLNEATGVPGLNRENAYRQPILLPPLDEQRRIAEVLRSVDEAVAAQVEVCCHLARTFNYLAEASFVQPHGQVSGAWTVLPMGEICESIQVGIVVRPASYYVPNGGIPALRSLNIGENYLNLDDLVYISEEGHRLNGKSSLRAGDIVTRRTGEPGKTAMIPACFPDGLNCIDIIFSRPKAIVRAEFVSFFMNSGAAKKQVIALQGGLAQQHLNVTEMKTLKVPVPPLDVQDEIITALQAAMANLERERALIDQWSRLQAALMSDLLSGRVRVPA